MGGKKEEEKKKPCKRGEGAEPWNVGTVAVNSISDCLGGGDLYASKKLEISTNVRKN